MTNKDFKFTVVIPVYKVEKYLEQTIDSVIGQTVGFRDSIQIILVNDGSPDKSGDICLRYHEKYPENILYLVKENGGVSSARNAAMKYIRGRYVNFLDSDDCWDRDAFYFAGEFFDKHYDEVDVVGCRKEFFDARAGYHYLDYKYESTRVIDLRNEPECIQLDVTGAFIKSEAIGDSRFCEKLKYGEDARFVTGILMDKLRLGVCREALHKYRKRFDQSSALQNDVRSESYYFDTPEYFMQSLLDESVRRYGTKEKFVQYTVMYELGWRIRKQNIKQYLTKEQYKKYCSILTGLLRQIDDDVIRSQRFLWKKHKIICLMIKHGMSPAAILLSRLAGFRTVFSG